MFDSWIQKQSSVGPNKQNIRSQRSTRNESSKRVESISKKFGGNLKNKDQSYQYKSKGFKNSNER